MSLLFTGGAEDGFDELDEILKYDKRSKTWIRAGKMKESRLDHAVAVLKDVSQLCP